MARSASIVPNCIIFIFIFCDICVSLLKTKEHNNRQNIKICIRNLDTKKEGQKANEHF